MIDTPHRPSAALRAPAEPGLAVARLLTAAVAGGALAGCLSAELAAPVLRARTGPAYERPIRRVVALPATCGALTLERVETADPAQPIWRERAACPQPALRAIDIAIRARLELGGYDVIDSERINAVTGSRRDTETRAGGEPVARTSLQTGARFEDATPFEQAKLLAQLGAEGVLSARIWVGAGVGAGNRRTVAVQVRLLANADGALAWARRCEIEVGGLTSDEAAMEQGARCAIAGTRAR